MTDPLTFDPEAIDLPCFTEARRHFLDGSDTPRAFLERCLERVDRYESSIRAFAWFDRDAPRKAADAATDRYRQNRSLSPVDGCPVAIKDIIETADMPTQMNSGMFEGWRPNRDAASVFALRSGGAIVFGKTVTTEFAMAAPGPTTNPFDHTRTPGGSSSGSAAAVGAGMVPAALGTQTAGSVVRPASFCGAFGFKPSHAALNMGGVHPISNSHDTLGTIAGSLHDAWLVARHIASVVGGTSPHAGLQGPTELPDARQPKTLIRLETEAWNETDEPTRTAFETAIECIQRSGTKILDRRKSAEVENLETLLQGVGTTARTISAFERRWPYFDYIARYPDKLSAEATKAIEKSRQISQSDFHKAWEKQESIRRYLTELSTLADGFVTLTASGPAPVGLEFTGSRSFQIFWTLTGAPCFTLPRMAVDGLPLGLQVLGFRDHDEDLAATVRWIDDRLRK